MAGITFSEGSGLNDSIYGKSQAPIRMFLEKRGESFEQQSIVKEIFAMEKSTHWSEKFTTMTAMNGFIPVGENGAYPIDNLQEGFSKTLEHMTWKDKFSISREIVDDSTTMDLKKQPAQFITGYYRTRERFGAALLGSAIKGETATAFGGKTFDATGADGKALFAKDHPEKLTKKTQSNQFADAFSNGALAAMETAMQDFRGDSHEILDVVPDTILIPNDYKLKKDVFAAIGADKDPNTSNNGFNYQPVKPLLYGAAGRMGEPGSTGERGEGRGLSSGGPARPGSCRCGSQRDPCRHEWRNQRGSPGRGGVKRRGQLCGNRPFRPRQLYRGRRADAGKKPHVLDFHDADRWPGLRHCKIGGCRRHGGHSLRSDYRLPQLRRGSRRWY